MPSHLFMRAIDDWHAQFHKAFQGRIAKAAGQREHMLYAFFSEGQSQQVAATAARDGLGVHKRS
jgi:hypothetical protein